MQSIISINQIDSKKLTDIFNQIKSIYEFTNICEDRKRYIIETVRTYGYLPYPHQAALEELTPAETITGIEEKLKLNNTYNGSEFCFTDISPLKRTGVTNSEWCKKEQHNIKLTNLAGLGNANESPEPAKFLEWLKYLLTLPCGNQEKGVFATTMYLVPFHPREFGCAYLPTSSEVSENLCDAGLKETLGLDPKQQVQLFLALTQLAGHPTMYDVLPQTGRFSKTILANSHIARWFDINAMVAKLKEALQEICDSIHHEKPAEYAQAKEIIYKRLHGEYLEIPAYIQETVLKINELLDEKRKELSNEMLKRENQIKLHQIAKQIINTKAGKDVHQDLSEDDIKNHGDIIGELIVKGLWPAPGGAWCSCGIPVFNEMSEGASYPTFKHYDVEGNDVTHFANLDCQTPYYFVNLEDGTYNEEVIRFYIDFLKKLQSDYNFDSFRVDHIDHIVDKVSETDKRPISYRAPRQVIGRANAELKSELPYFATLAEYMLWENFLEEYHKDMNFDLLWGSDIISQYLKNPEQITKDNKVLEDYNSTIDESMHKLSFLKCYNNQDGEFEAIDQYPGQLGEAGALFKWFKFKFIPGGQLAQRPVMFIDGDEGFNKTGIEGVINSETSMKRDYSWEFYKKFDAISRFALNNDLTLFGKAQLLEPSEEVQEGFISWNVSLEDRNEELLILANQNPPTEKLKDEDGKPFIKEGEAIEDISVKVPEGCKLVSEYSLELNASDFSQKNIEDKEVIQLNRLEPSEFKVYKLLKK